MIVSLEDVCVAVYICSVHSPTCPVRNSQSCLCLCCIVERSVLWFLYVASLKYNFCKASVFMFLIHMIKFFPHPGNIAK